MNTAIERLNGVGGIDGLADFRWVFKDRSYQPLLKPQPVKIWSLPTTLACKEKWREIK